jgi:hypothetical protein
LLNVATLEVGMILFLSFLSSHFTLAKTYEIMAGRKKKLTQKLADQILESNCRWITQSGKRFEKVTDFTWQSFRTYLINDEELMFRYQKSKELAVDLKLSQLEDKRKELEAKIESGQIDGKAGQNLVNFIRLLLPIRSGLRLKLHQKSMEKLLN